MRKMKMDNETWKPKPRSNKSAPNFVIDQIRDALLNKNLHPGDRLPSEGELSEMFGISRGSVRQAMKSLETLGVISIRPGDGTYVNTVVSENHLNPLVFALLISNPSQREITETRYALERDILELVLDSEEYTNAVIPKLENNIQTHRELLERKASTEELVENDQKFHRLLSGACGNTVLRTIYDYVLDSFKPQMIHTTSKQDSGGTNVTVRDHERILNALKAHSFSDAKQACKESVASWIQYM